MERCSRCVTPTSYPGTRLNSDGVCNQCLDYESKYAHWDETRAQRAEKFRTILDQARRRSSYYHALVPLSGGKDSAYVLYLATKVYNLRVLCYTIDNGFHSPIAKENIASALAATGADHFVFRPHHGSLMKLYRHFLEHTGMFCPVCMRGITAGSFFVSHKFNIPLILTGSSEKTEERLVPDIFQDGDLSFFKKVLKEHPFPDDIQAFLFDRTFFERVQRALFLLTGGRISQGRMDIYMPDYHDWNYAEIYSTISFKLGWRSLPDRDEHVDCLVEPIVHYFIRETRVPELTPSTLRYSAEIRAGQRTREEALAVVEKEDSDRVVPKETSIFLERMGMTEEELRKLMTDGRRHMKYQTGGFVRRAVAFLRSRRTS